MFLGILDPWIWGGYVLLVLSMILCVVYGLINWNKD
ncbi:symporter small accessory protein [Methanobrevibacter filiformis]